jgi:hypothetical protein
MLRCSLLGAWHPGIAERFHRLIMLKNALLPRSDVRRTPQDSQALQLELLPDS